ncbi:hypothetical protein HK098_005432 [Nowakowskiella sp. JEL0407]|nr:hypothetical protein HK098_005432 [Nowakowskiella sp. JEL0407]
MSLIFKRFYSSKSPVSIGFIGLGNMGFPMATNILSKTTCPFHIHDTSSDTLSKFISQNSAHKERIKTHSTPKSVISESEVLLTMLPSPKIVESVYLGKDGIVNGILGKGQKLPGQNHSKTQYILDCSSIDPSTTKKVDKNLSEKAMKEGVHIHFSDSPVSGGTISAQSGQLTFMLGKGVDKRLISVVLESMGKVVDAGGLGNGVALKMVNNMLLGVTMVAVSEAFTLGKRMGLSAEKINEVVNLSSGRCWVTEKYHPHPDLISAAPASNHYAPGFDISLMAKDMSLAIQAANETKSSVFVSAVAGQLYNKAAEEFKGKDFSIVYKAYPITANISLLFSFSVASLSQTSVRYSFSMPTQLAEPVLTLAFDNLSKIKAIDEDEISTIWQVFTKCKDNLENGRRLENISWRLWHRATSHSGSTSSRSSTNSQSNLEATSSSNNLNNPISTPHTHSNTSSVKSISPSSFGKILSSTDFESFRKNPHHPHNRQQQQKKSQLGSDILKIGDNQLSKSQQTSVQIQKHVTFAGESASSSVPTPSMLPIISSNLNTPSGNKSAHSSEPVTTTTQVPPTFSNSQLHPTQPSQEQLQLYALQQQQLELQRKAHIKQQQLLMYQHQQQQEHLQQKIMQKEALERIASGQNVASSSIQPIAVEQNKSEDSGRKVKFFISDSVPENSDEHILMAKPQESILNLQTQQQPPPGPQQPLYPLNANYPVSVLNQQQELLATEKIQTLQQPQETLANNAPAQSLQDATRSLLSHQISQIVPPTATFTFRGNHDEDDDEDDYDDDDDDDFTDDDYDDDEDSSDETIYSENHQVNNQIFQKVDLPQRSSSSTAIPRTSSALSMALQNNNNMYSRSVGDTRAMAQHSAAAAAAAAAAINGVQAVDNSVAELTESLRQTLEWDRRMPFNTRLSRRGEDDSTSPNTESFWNPPSNVW